MKRMKRNRTQTELPNSRELEQELSRVRAESRSGWGTFKDCLTAVLVTAAAMVLLTAMLLPVMRIQGESMAPALNGGDVTIALKHTELRRGDICFFYSGNRILCKRIIGFAGDVIEMDEAGNVYVNGELLEEPYLADKDLGHCEIAFPYTVPEGTFFVMGDNREISRDSRSEEVGCVPEEQMIGKLLLRVWPLSGFGTVA